MWLNLYPVWYRPCRRHATRTESDHCVVECCRGRTLEDPGGAHQELEFVDIKDWKDSEDPGYWDKDFIDMKDWILELIKNWNYSEDPKYWDFIDIEDWNDSEDPGYWDNSANKVGLFHNYKYKYKYKYKC